MGVGVGGVQGEASIFRTDCSLTLYLDLADLGAEYIIHICIYCLLKRIFIRIYCLLKRIYYVFLHIYQAIYFPTYFSSEHPKTWVRKDVRLLRLRVLT